MDEPAGPARDPATTDDGLLGGRLRLLQPAKGHRIGTDAILLATAAPSQGVDHLVDVGAGVGAVGLALLERIGGARADLIEWEADLAALAEQNAARNGLAARARVLRVDINQSRGRREAGLSAEAADLVVTNPPFFEAASVRVSPEPKRAGAHVFGRPSAREAAAGSLEAWIVASLRLLRPGGRFIVIHRPDALAQILIACGRRLGAIAILPVHPSAGAPAHRMLMAGVKGARGPISLRPGLILHDETGAFTPFVQALHRGEASIDWGDQPRRPRSDRAAAAR
jgi:tRNA1(Val) A37 N6-methylase TrmN6